MGLLEMREPKSVMAGMWRRGRWDVIRLRGDEQELKVEVVKDTVVYSSEVLELELGGLHTEPFEKGDFIVVEVRLLKDVDVPLVLLSMSWRVVNVTSNGGLM